MMLGRHTASAGVDQRQRERRRPWWQLSLFERFSIGVQVAGFVVVLALIVVGLSYRAYVASAQDLIRQAESENLSGAAHVARARIDAESRVLNTVSQALARHPAVRQALQDGAAPSLAEARQEFDASFAMLVAAGQGAMWTVKATGGTNP